MNYDASKAAKIVPCIVIPPHLRGQYQEAGSMGLRPLNSRTTR